MADQEPYELFVFILGDSVPSSRMFPITAPASDSVDKLKRLIYANAQNRLKGIAAIDLILWKVLPLCSFPLTMS
jgi:hypothetical protein